MLELLEMRVSRLERIVAANVGHTGPTPKLASDTIVYWMDDPRLILLGAHGLETGPNNMTFRWFGQGGSIQLVFPHTRACAQDVRLLLHPARDIDLGLIRIIVDEAKIVPRLAPAQHHLQCMSFQIPAGYGLQTEIEMQNVAVTSPKDFGGSDSRMLSFALYKAEFSAVPGYTT